MGAIPLLIISVVISEIVGQLVFYRFRFGWKTVLPVVLIGIILIPVVAAIGETTTAFAGPNTAPATFSGSFIFWILIRMYNRKGQVIPKHEKSAGVTKNRTDSVVAEIRKQKPTPQSPSASKTLPDSTKAANAPPRSPDPSSTKSSLKDLDDNQLYAIGWKEVEEDNRDEGLWARLFVENDGDETKTRVAYLKHRVDALHEQRRIEIENWEKNEQVKKEAEDQLAEAAKKYREDQQKKSREAIERWPDEEQGLLSTIRAVNPFNLWRQDQPLQNLLMFKNAIKARDHAKVLQMLRSGANPNSILSDTSSVVSKALSRDAALESILIIAARLWKNGKLTRDGIAEQ